MMFINQFSRNALDYPLPRCDGFLPISTDEVRKDLMSFVCSANVFLKRVYYERRKGVQTGALSLTSVQRSPDAMFKTLNKGLRLFYDHAHQLP